MKIEFPKDMYLHLMAVDTQWVDNMADDDLFLVHATVNNGEFNARKQNAVTLRLAQSGTEVEALRHGGLLMMSNLKKQTIRKAVMLGLQLLATNGAISPDDYLGQDDGGATQHAD